MNITETTEKWKDAIKNEVLIETHNIQVTPLKKRGKVRTEFLEKWGTNGEVIKIDKNNVLIKCEL